MHVAGPCRIGRIFLAALPAMLRNEYFQLADKE